MEVLPPILHRWEGVQQNTLLVKKEDSSKFNNGGCIRRIFGAPALKTYNDFAVVELIHHKLHHIWRNQKLLEIIYAMKY